MDRNTIEEDIDGIRQIRFIDEIAVDIMAALAPVVYAKDSTHKFKNWAEVAEDACNAAEALNNELIKRMESQ